jgi:hypothetical protein
MKWSGIGIFMFIVLFWCAQIQGQENKIRMYHLTSAHTAFPDTGRIKGYSYDNVFYDAATHYQDSSVFLIVPEDLKINKKVDFIFWFHGWRNNIDSAAVRYELIRQFQTARLNAILVLAETAKDAPDSYGGKLEQPGQFKSLVQDVVKELTKKQIIPSGSGPGKIVLAGHSGAYRVMGYILQNGKIAVQKVILFDALYGETDKFMHWIKVNWFTDNAGGTNKVSMDMMKQLQQENINYCTIEEGLETREKLTECSLIFVHSIRPHNDIINKPDNFLDVLETDVKSSLH